MSKLARAGLLLFAGLLLLVATIPPLLAQEPGCRPLEAVASEAAEAAAAGAEIHVLTGPEAAAAMAFLEARLGPWPRPERPTTLILAIGPHAGLVAFGEGIQACLMLPIPRGMGAEIVKAARGEPA
ncbi:MAG: hypothetical protein B7Z14_08180 [Bosea sp. 32-68-6]|nr:MAG: hypothetical protein B7Z14_08180 [Bosea sp. 32-68-6]